MNVCNTCPHYNSIEDHSTGDEICTDCGLVLDKIYLNQNILYKDENIYNTSEKQHDIINDLCSKINIDNVPIKTQIVKRWNDLIKKNKKPTLDDEVCCALACIYMGLIDSGFPRPISHLCQPFDVNIKSVWSCMKANNLLCRPSLMCEYFLHSLNLTFKEIEQIRKIVREKEMLFVFSPKTLIASCAYVFLREQREKEKSKKYPITISYMAKDLGVSPMAMYRCIKRIK